MKVELDLNECMELHALLGMHIYQLENSRIMTEQLKSFLDLDRKLMEKLTNPLRAKNEIKVRDILKVMYEGHHAEIFTEKANYYGQAYQLLKDADKKYLDAEVINIEIADDDNTINIIASEGTEESK